MNIYVLVIISTLLMFLATVLGAAFVFIIPKVNAMVERICLGFASGIMIAASIFSLLLPALDSTKHCFLVIMSILIGGLFLWVLDFFLSSKEKKQSFFFLAVTLHNIPEGMIVGLACALTYTQNSMATLATTLALAIGIAIQNIPEGMAVSFTLLEEGKGKGKAFLYGMVSGIVEPIFGILMVLLSHVLEPFMPFFLSLAAGTMFYVVVDELIPKSKVNNSNSGVVSFMIGFAIMMYLDVILG